LSGEELNLKETTRVPVNRVELPTTKHTPMASAYSPMSSVAPRESNRGPSWHFWWLLFVLLILGLGAAVMFQIWDTKLIRDASLQSDTVIHSRIDSTDAQLQNQMQERTNALELRFDQLVNKTNELQLENIALKARIDSTAFMCQTTCQSSSK